MHVRIIANGNLKVFSPLTNQLTTFCVERLPFHIFQPPATRPIAHPQPRRAWCCGRQERNFPVSRLASVLLLSLGEEGKALRVSDADEEHELNLNRPSVA